jgi:hypothetical protein
MLIAVKETHPPAVANRSGTVVTMDGQKLDCWPDKLAAIRVGMSYEIETSSREKNGRTYVSITKATPVNGTASTTNGNGTAHPVANGNGSSHTPAATGSLSTEAAFVREVLAALILKGEVPYTKRALFDATQTLRGLYGATFGGRANGQGGGDD